MLNSHGRPSRQPGRFPAKRSQMERRAVPSRDRSVLHTLVVDSLAEQIAIVDRAANIVDVNAAWRRFALENGLAPELLAAGRSYLELLAATSPADSRHGKYAAGGVLNVLGGRQALLRLEYPMRAGDRDRWYVMRVSRLENTRRPLFVSSHFDITERHHAEEEALHLSRHDSLTGLGNRRQFEEALANEVRRSARRNAPVSLVAVDVDIFKDFNDWHGHVAGDQCLVRVAEVLAQHARRPGDLAARLGGDEFALILGDTDQEAAERIANEIRELVVGFGMLHGSSRAPVTVSIGVATVHAQGSHTERSLFAAADRALYRAKSAGRNRVECEGIGGDAGASPSPSASRP